VSQQSTVTTEEFKEERLQMEQNDSEIASSTVDSAISVPPSDDSATEELKVIATEEQIRPVFSNSLVVSKLSVTLRLFIWSSL